LPTLPKLPTLPTLEMRWGVGGQIANEQLCLLFNVGNVGNLGNVGNEWR
jgi:hypothetical protein